MSAHTQALAVKSTSRTSTHVFHTRCIAVVCAEDGSPGYSKRHLVGCCRNHHSIGIQHVAGDKHKVVGAGIHGRLVTRQREFRRRTGGRFDFIGSDDISTGIITFGRQRTFLKGHFVFEPIAVVEVILSLLTKRHAILKQFHRRAVGIQINCNCRADCPAIPIHRHNVNHRGGRPAALVHVVDVLREACKVYDAKVAALGRILIVRRRLSDIIPTSPDEHTARTSVPHHVMIQSNTCVIAPRNHVVVIARTL